MLKGVHHQIIEIRQTDDPYFERALLFVRASCAPFASEEEAERRGKALVARAKPYTGLRRARLRRWMHTSLCVFGGGASGVAMGLMLSKWV